MSDCLFPNSTKSYNKGCRCISCRKCKSDTAKIHYLKHKDRIDKRCIDNQNKKPEYYKKYRSEYYIKNAEQIKKKTSEYRKNNRMKTNLRHMEKMANDPFYALQHRMRGRMHIAFNKINHKKNKSTLAILGCSVEELKNLLQEKFKDGMSWSNYGQGGWVVDHIIPLASAKNDINKLCALCHYTNLQPLWESENCSKGDKIL